MQSFSHLHVRSGFSYGYGVATPEELVEAASRREMDSLAITDRDGLYGVPRFLMACEEKGLSPIIGAEITMEDGGHVVLLAESMAGYRSLSKLITAYRCGSRDRRNPLCSLELLLDHAESLICLTGAIPQGLLPHLLLERGRQDSPAAGSKSEKPPVVGSRSGSAEGGALGSLVLFVKSPAPTLSGPTRRDTSSGEI